MCARRYGVALILAGLLVAAGCGDDEDSDASGDTTTTTEATGDETTTTAAAAGVAVDACRLSAEEIGDLVGFAVDRETTPFGCQYSNTDPPRLSGIVDITTANAGPLDPEDIAANAAVRFGADAEPVDGYGEAAFVFDTGPVVHVHVFADGDEHAITVSDFNTDSDPREAALAIADALFG